MHKLRSDILSGEQERPSPVAVKAKVGASGTSLAAIPVKRAEPRLTNHRAGDRLPGVMATTTLTLRRRKIEADVVNLSSDGAMLRGAFDVRIGEPVAIALGDGTTGKCTVRWVRDDRIGVEFDGYSLELGRDADGSFAFRRNDTPRRAIAERAARTSLAWRANVHAGDESIAVKVCNVSTTGALLEGVLMLEVGAGVLLDLSGSGAGTIPGVVRWADEGRVGISFTRHFDVAALAICAPATEAAARTIDWVKPEYGVGERGAMSSNAARWNKLVLANMT